MVDLRYNGAVGKTGGNLNAFSATPREPVELRLYRPANLAVQQENDM
jgi:hypothetical protein